MSTMEPLSPLKLGYVTDLNYVREAARYGDLLFLERLNLKEAWDAFVCELFEKRCEVHQKHIAWLEDRIPQLFFREGQSGGHPYEDLAQKLTDWYLFQSSNTTKTVVPAITFAINLYLDCVVPIGDFPKKILRRLGEGDHYWEVSSTERFIHSILGDIRHRGNRYTYMEESWNFAERAINLILKAQDVTMLPLLDKILAEHEAGKIRLWEDGMETRRFERAKILAILREAVAMLKEMHKEQRPSLTKTVGESLAKEAELEGGVLIKVRYPEKLSAEEAVKGAAISLELECEHQSDRDKLRQFLAKNKDSFCIYLNWARFKDPKRFTDRVYLETLTMENTLVPEVGTTARFSFRFYADRNSPVTYIGYIQVEAPVTSD